MHKRSEKAKGSFAAVHCTCGAQSPVFHSGDQTKRLRDSWWSTHIKKSKKGKS